MLRSIAIAKIALAVGTIGLAANYSAKAEEINVGAPLPLTGGLASYAGPIMKSALEIAAEHINQDHLLGPDRTIKLIIDDFGSEKAQAIALTTRLITRDNVLALVGPPISPPALAAVPVANELKTPMIGIAYSEDVVKSGPWGFKLYEHASKGMGIMATFAHKKLGLKKIAVVYDKAIDGMVSLKDAFVTSYKKEGGQIASEDAYISTDTNFSAVATKIVDEEPDAVFLSAEPEAGANLIIQMKQAGLSPQTKFFGIAGFNGPSFVRVGGRAVEGTYYPADYFSGLDTAANKRFVEAYKKKTGKGPDVMAGSGYHTTMLVAEAIKRAGPGGSREAVRDALASLKDFPGIFGAGTYSFASDRTGSYDILILKVENGAAAIAQ
jgi:branched-chain amino acid transport system substrate-binding protein